MFNTCTLHKIQVPTKMGEISPPFQHTLAHCVTSVQLKWLLIQTLNERKNVVTDCCCIRYIILQTNDAKYPRWEGISEILHEGWPSMFARRKWKYGFITIW